MDFTKIKAIYRQPDTLSLFGLPYAANPREVERGYEERLAAWRRSLGKGGGAPKPEPLGWIWLGSPGWWGPYGHEDQAEIRAFLAGLGDLVPQYPGEWCDLTAEPFSDLVEGGT